MTEREPQRNNDIAITRRECDKCYGGMRDWIAKIDGRVWALLVMGFVQLCALIGILLEKVLSK